MGESEVYIRMKEKKKCGARGRKGGLPFFYLYSFFRSFSFSFFSLERLIAIADVDEGSWKSGSGMNE